MAIKDELKLFKKERILQTAQQLFYERGFRGTTIDAIAESLEITKPFVYGAYDKKTDILVDIYLRIVERSLEAVDNARRSGGTPSTQLRTCARLLTEVTLGDKTGVAVFFREEKSIPSDRLAAINTYKGRIDDGIAGILADGAATGEFQLDDVRTAALAIGGMISWSYTWFRPEGRLDITALAEHMATYALRIAGAREAN